MNVGLPPPLMTSEPGSFARHTIVERKPQIIRQVIEDNGYPPDIVQALEAFREEIASQPVRPLREQVPAYPPPAPSLGGRGEHCAPSPCQGEGWGEGEAHICARPYPPPVSALGESEEWSGDVASWNRELAAYQGRTWLDLPWYFAEAYFYRRLLEAVRYFQPGPWQGRDPFEKQKQEQQRAAVAQLAEAWGQLANLDPLVAFPLLLHSSLWSNRADLSNFTVRVRAQVGVAADQERHHILIDHTEPVTALLTQGLQRVDFINDNVGVDLLFDLALADFLLVQGWARGVVFHLKRDPFFVSDAMPKDMQTTISHLQSVADPAARELGVRLRSHLEAGRLLMEDDPFWTSCLTFRQLPPALQADLACAELVVLKGDVNYRRLLDDRHWPHTARMEEIAHYFPTSFLTLRTLKGEILVGLAPGQAEALAAADPTWLINGKRGIIQLVIQ